MLCDLEEDGGIPSDMQTAVVNVSADEGQSSPPYETDSRGRSSVHGPGFALRATLFMLTAGGGDNSLTSGLMYR
jgi:hypothetical protein